MPCTVDGGRSSRCAISPRLSRWSPWSTARIRSARSTDWITGSPPSGARQAVAICVCVARTSREEHLVDCIANTCVISDHHSTLSNDVRQNGNPAAIRRDGDRGRLQESSMDEPSILQKLAAEVIGTAFLVFIGVGSVPATLIVNGDAPFTMADLGMISLAFGTIVSRPSTRSATSAGTTSTPPSPSASRSPASSRGARCRRYIAAQVRRRRHRRRRDHRRCSGQKASDVGLGVASYADTVGACRRRSPPSSSARSSSCSRSSASSTARRRPASPGWPSAWSCSRRSSRSPRPPAPRSTRRARSARCSSSRSPAAR